jgi:two-component system chemotaxis response regulator CheY
VSDEVRELISRRASEHAIRKAARNAGMRSLLEDGIVKAARGLTTLEDVVRVVAADDAATLKEEATKPETMQSSSPPDQAETHSKGAERSAERGATAHISRKAGLDSDEAPSPLTTELAKLGNYQERERVLVVEDSTTIASVVKYFLELEGLEVFVAKDGILGLEAAKRDHPHVIVTDYNMPGMDGMAMVKALRAEAATRDIAVLMLTSEDSVEKEAQALEAGVDGYILKPVEPRRLAARVRSLLVRSQRRHPAIV